MHKFAVAFGVASLLAPVLFAAPPAGFVSRGIGGGGAMYSPTINPHDSDEMYVGCDMSLQFHTRDRGKTWARIADESVSAIQVLNVNSGAFDPRNPKEFYMATEYDGVLWTPDITAAKPEFRPVAAYRFAQPMRIRFNPGKPSEMWVTSVGNGLNMGVCE